MSQIGLAIRRADLAQVATNGTEDHHLPPAEVGAHDERVETVRLALSLVGGQERLQKLLPCLHRPTRRNSIPSTGHGYPKVVDERTGAVAERQLVRALVDNVNSEKGQVRQDLRQRD